MGTMDLVHRLVDSALKLANSLPSSRWVTASRVALSTLLLVLAIWSIVRSRREGDRLVAIAIDSLRSHIRQRATEPALMSATSIRALAKAIQTSLHSPALTDGAIAEAIRAEALAMEERHRGAALLRRLEALNRPLKELDPQGGSLLSIAAIDRMLAYTLSGFSILTEIALLQLALEVAAWSVARGTRTGLWIGVPLWLFPFAYFVMAWAGRRATAAWSARVDAAGGKSAQHESRTYRALDFLARQAASHDHRFLHLIWGPIWEAALLVTPWAVEMHQYKYFEVRRLQGQLKRSAGAGLDLALDGLAELTAEETALCRRLWVLTGDIRFRSAGRLGAEQEGHN